MSRKVDWDGIKTNWAEVMKRARAEPKMQECIDFDGEGRIITSNRPMIESLICARSERRARILYYLQMLGLHEAPGRIIELDAGNKMPFRSGGKGKKVKGKK